MASSDEMALCEETLLYGPVFFEATNDDLFGNGILEIMVGQSKFDVHKQALIQVSDFFARVFRDQKKPKIKLGSMVLPDEDPDTFQRFVKWTYAKFGGSDARASVAHLEAQFRGVSRRDLLRLYILAVRFQIGVLEDEIVSLFYDRLDRGFEKIATLGVDDEFLAHLAAHLDRGTALYKLLSRAIAFRMATNPYQGVPCRRNPVPTVGTVTTTVTGQPGGSNALIYTRQQQHQHHPYPSNLSKAVMRYAAKVIPERLLRSIMKDFFDLHTLPILKDFGLEVGPLLQYLVVEPVHN